MSGLNRCRTDLDVMVQGDIWNAPIKIKCVTGWDSGNWGQWIADHRTAQWSPSQELDMCLGLRDYPLETARTSMRDKNVLVSYSEIGHLTRRLKKFLGEFWFGSISGQTIVYVGGDRVHDHSTASASVIASTGIEAKFTRLAAKWKQKTAHLSSPGMIAEHPAYQEIVGMGPDVIPLILRDLKEAPAQWFWALRSITGESPIRPEDRGDIDAMRVAWLDWGERYQYI